MRVESAMLRAYNSGTRAAPYESLMVADIGDINVNLYDLKDTCKRITEAYRKIVATGCIPLTMGEVNHLNCHKVWKWYQRLDGTIPVDVCRWRSHNFISNPASCGWEVSVLAEVLFCQMSYWLTDGRFTSHSNRDHLPGMDQWVWSMWMLMLTPVMSSWVRRLDMGLHSDVVWRTVFWTVREWSRSACGARVTLQMHMNGAGPRYSAEILNCMNWCVYFCLPAHLVLQY